MPEEYKNQIVAGDCRELAKRIPDESVDLILCDPVYPEVEQYSWVAKIAGRVLKSGGSVIAQSGEVYRFDAETAFYDSQLERRRPLLTELYSGGFKTIWKHRALKSAHPWLWSEKGKPNPDRGWPRTAFFGLKDKRIHKWGDGERGYAFIMSRMSEPGDVIFDPFVGGGTVPAVCIQLERNYIAFEIDPDTAELARKRVRETQPPLFVEQPTQKELL